MSRYFVLLICTCVLSIGMVFTSCDQSTESESPQSDTLSFSPQIIDNEDVDKTGNKNIAPGTVSNDSIYISGNFILFFSPSDKEINTMTESNTQPPGYLEMINEFKEMSTNVFDSLKAMNVPINLATSSVETFCLTMDEGNNMYFNRSSLKFPVGLIMMDGLQAPVIRSGNHIKADYFQFIKSYFVAIDLEQLLQYNSPSI